MKEKDSFNIRWTQITSNTFMYGTQFRFHASETVFQNELMPSGIVIHQWEMMTNFQKDKTIPTLPILKKDQTYHFKFDYDVEPSHCIYFKIIFKHRDNTVCDVQIIRGHEAEVRMPQQAFNYELQMINAASKVVKFRQICIKEGEDAQLDNQLYISDIQNKVSHLPIVNIVFVEKNGVSNSALRQFPNCITVHNWDVASMAQAVSNLTARINALGKQCSLHFIGYHSRSNVIACVMASHMKGTAFVTQRPNHDEVEMNTDVAHVVVYQTEDHLDTGAFQLVEPLLNPSRHLAMLQTAKVCGGEQ
ncbi:accessory Sec system protein Asp3 [Staphylococcus schleiferi]|uniref:accessory Sec system protein Asp3 n=1 Tax=Staphylococcus sp. 191 TaxID=2070016 RepID=UPI0013F3CF81|nr:accessory Sec system protein Asp3 [Staphylococcus sp. 191]NHA36612.1 accessory Sec system protein Asp3 [Staphylococcus schleiferi]NHB72252.1 accessory Sec system protein Asp3 [Staphylococcus sp. 191]